MTRTINAYNPDRPHCSVDDCLLEAFTKGYCEDHYRRFKHSGSPYGASGRPPAGQSICQAVEDNCDRPVKADGYCTLHLYRYRTHGSPYVRARRGASPTVRHLAPVCKATKENCDRRAVTKGYCQKHYDRVRRNGDPYTVRTRTRPDRERAPGLVEVAFPLHNPAVSVLDAFAGAAELLPARLARRGLAPQGRVAYAVMDGVTHPGSDGAPFVVVARVQAVPLKTTWRNTPHNPGRAEAAS